MDTTRTRHARRWALRFVVALVSALLAVPALSLASASAALDRTDALPILPDLPVGTDIIDPAISGAGRISGPLAFVCSNLAGAEGAPPVSCPDAYTVSELLTNGLSQVTLVPTPAAGWEFTGWQDCADSLSGAHVSGDNCVIPVGALSVLLQPVASFVPTEGPDDPGLPSVCDSPIPVSDCVAPVTELTKSPTVTDGKTKEKAAVFEFAAFEPDETGAASTTPTEGATFTCQLTGPGQTAAAAACTSPKTYDDLADGSYTFTVVASDAASPPNTDETPEKFTWTVDTTAPQTVLSNVRSWVLKRNVGFELSTSPEEPATYACFLDGQGRLCTASGGTVRVGEGTHTLAAAATDSAGNEDTTPDTDTFTLPVNNTELNPSRGWKKDRAKGHFLKTYSKSSKHGATLKYGTSSIKRVALVVTKGRGYGTVKVYLGRHLLKKVSLSAKKTNKRKLVKIANFSTARSGKIKIRIVSNHKPVVIEGLGIASR